MKPAIKTSLWVIYFLCVIPALVTIGHRMEFDRGFNSAALVADYVQLLELAQTGNVPIEDVLGRVRDEGGITRIALLEDTPEFLAQRGLCTIVEGVGWPGWKTPEERDEIERNRGREIEEASAPETDWPLLMGLNHDRTHLIFTDRNVYQRIADTASQRYIGLVEVTDMGDEGGIVSLSGEPKIILEWGMGFDPELVSDLRGRGFVLYPRLRNFPGFTDEIINGIYIDTFNQFPGSTIIYDGDSILGGTAHVKSVSEEFKNSDLRIGWVEFAEQRGASVLASLAPSRTVRVHSIEDEEMEIITPEWATSRYLRAVRERACRILYLKPFLLAKDNENLVDKTIRMFAMVKNSVESKDFTIGEPSVIPEAVQANVITRSAGLIAMYAGFILLLSTLKIKVTLSKMAALAVVFLGMFVASGGLGIKIITLGIALVSPTLAVAWLVSRYDGIWIEVRKLRITPIWPAIGNFFAVVLITLNGGLLIAASLINEKTLLQIDAFSGVKLALYLPILAAVLIGVQLILPEEKRTMSSAVAWLMNMQIRVWHVILGLVGILALFIMIDRSGNFPIFEVADWENKVRGWFEAMLYARPRTKEMLVGHPAMFIGIFFGLGMLQIRRVLMYAGVVIGSIGLTSMTNTFCHIHTPFILSIFRTVAGLTIGWLIGLAVTGIVLLAIKAWNRIAAKTTMHSGS